MRIIARSSLLAFAKRHTDAGPALRRWEIVVRGARWEQASDVSAAFSGCKVLNGERVRFAIGGGKYRLVAAFDFRRQIAFVKFIGTHAEYDAVDVLTVSQF